MQHIEMLAERRMSVEIDGTRPQVPPTVFRAEVEPERVCSHTGFNRGFSFAD
jgi:hypothetical protein